MGTIYSNCYQCGATIHSYEDKNQSDTYHSSEICHSCQNENDDFDDDDD